MICHGQDLLSVAITVFHKGRLAHWNGVFADEVKFVFA
jgi:hypothetical protein